jgi:uncharacterized membrane protein
MGYMDEAAGLGVDAATYAVISIHVAHKGSKVLLPCPISTVAQLRESLMRLSTEFCSDKTTARSSLSSLELLDFVWSPMLPTETITRKDLYARYPELRDL